MVEVVPFTGTFTHAGKHGVTTVLLGDVVDEFHHVDGLAHAGTAEEADLTALGERADQVDNLDAGFEQIDGRGEFVELRGFTMDFATFFGADFTAIVDRAAEHVHDAAEGLGTDGHGDAAAGALDLHAALEAFRRAHGNGTDNAVAKLLLHFEGQATFGQGIAFILFEDESFVNLRHRVAGELNVHHSADNLNDLSDTHGYSSVIDTYSV